MFKLSIGDTFNILRHELNTTKLSARQAPRMLTPHQQHARVQCCEQFLAACGDDADGFIQFFFTDDETLTHHYDPESNQ
jgi:hypothetical protein